MKTMKIKLMAIMMVVVLAFTGCMKVDLTSVINQDGSANISVSVLMDRQVILDSIAEASGVALTEADIKLYDQSMAEEGMTVVTVDGKQYYQSLENDTVKPEKLSEYFAGEGIDSYVTADTVYIHFKDVEAVGGEDMAEMQAYMAEMEKIFH